MGRWAPHLEQLGAVKRWQLEPTKYLGLGQNVTASLTVASGPKGRLWWGRRCKGHSPLRREAPGLGGQPGRPPPSAPAEMNMKLVCCCCKTKPGVPWLCRFRIPPCPLRRLPTREIGASKTCASLPVSPQLWDSAPTGASPLPPQADLCERAAPLLHFPGGYQLLEHSLDLLSWNPSAQHLALFEIPSHQAFQFWGSSSGFVEGGPRSA